MDHLGDSFDDKKKQQKRQVHSDRPYDESVQFDDGEDVVSQFEATPRVFEKQKFSLDKKLELDAETPKNDEDDDDDDDVDDDDDEDDEDDDDDDGDNDDDGNNNGHPKLSVKSRKKTDDDDDDDEEEEDGDDDDEEDEDDDEDDDDDNLTNRMVYNPSEFENLPVSKEVKELFQYITRYTPQSIELKLELKAFIPEYIPAVGDIDAFLKIPRPDGKTDTLGLTVLDEPCLKQSDPNVLDLMLRSLNTSKNANHSNNKIQVKNIDSTQDDAHKHITSWIKNIDKLHRSKPSPSVHYSKKMPEMDELMQEWEEPIESILREDNSPFDFDCDLPSTVDLVCGVCDIPVYNSRIQSLHLLFSLYSEFKNSHHFQRKRKN